MQERFISLLEHIRKEFQLKYISIHSEESTVVITPLVINFRIFLDMCIIGVAGFGVYTIQDKEFYLIPIVFVSGVLLVMILLDFRPINKIKVDFYSRYIQIQNRNVITRLFIKYILKKKQSFLFDEILSFNVRSNESFEIGLLRYYIDVKLKDETRRPVISFQKEGQADNVARALNSLLTS